MKGPRIFSEPDLANMQDKPNERANEIGKRKPYHLQYLREGGVNIKPREEKKDEREINADSRNKI